MSIASTSAPPTKTAEPQKRPLLTQGDQSPGPKLDAEDDLAKDDRYSNVACTD
jgi:hypothetical protein